MKWDTSIFGESLEKGSKLEGGFCYSEGNWTWLSRERSNFISGKIFKANYVNLDDQRMEVRLGFFPEELARVKCKGHSIRVEGLI